MNYMKKRKEAKPKLWLLFNYLINPLIDDCHNVCVIVL